MSIERRLQELARFLGLTSYEVKAYLALVEKGPMTAREVSQSAGVPQSKAYTVLHRLARMGFVDVDNSKRPEVFSAKAPRDVFRALIKRFEDYIDSIRPLVDSLQLMYETTHGGYVSAQSEVMYVVKGVENAKELMVRAMTEGNVDMAMPYREMLDHRILSSLEDLSRGNDVRLLVTRELLDVVRSLPPRIAIRVRDRLFGGGVVGREGVVLVLRRGGEVISLYSRQDYIVDIAKTYFNSLWKDAEVPQVQ